MQAPQLGPRSQLHTMPTTPLIRDRTSRSVATLLTRVLPPVRAAARVAAAHSLQLPASATAPNISCSTPCLVSALCRVEIISGSICHAHARQGYSMRMLPGQPFLGFAFQLHADG